MLPIFKTKNTQLNVFKSDNLIAILSKLFVFITCKQIKKLFFKCFVTVDSFLSNEEERNVSKHLKFKIFIFRF